MTTSQIAQGLAGLGRGGDSVLVHMQPQEVAGLQAIAQANGTSLTTNPDTGMPEAFSLGGFFKSLLPFAAGAALAPMTGGTSLAFMGTPLGAGLTVGALTGLATGDLKQGVMSGLGAAGGAGFSQGIMNAGSSAVNLSPEQLQAGGAQQAAEASARQAAGMPTSTPIGPSYSGSGTFPTGAQPAPYAGFTNEVTGQVGANLGYTPQLANPVGSQSMMAGASPSYGGINAGATSGMTDIAQAGTSGFDQFGQGIKNIASSDNPWEAYKNAVGAKSDIGAFGKAAGVLGPAVLAGLEPPNMLTQEEIDAQRRAKYNQPLNLNRDTGLRLAAAGGEMRLAGGGAIAFDDGGAVPNSRLSLRREEEQMAPQSMMQPAQTELGIAALKPNQENDVNISIQSAQPSQMQQQEQQVQPLAARAAGEGIPAALQQLGGEGVDFEKLYGRTQAPTAMAPSMQRSMGFGPDGRRLAAGGSIQSGGVMDLYQGSDTQPTFGGSQGYGLGRLNSLAQQQSLNNAEQGRFARGGVPRLEDGGFVVPADVTFYMGDHNTEAGQRRLNKMYGGQPIKGPGSGLSDSIPTSIEGRQPARIANGEVYIPRKAVMAHGGPQKFYKMMDKVRKKATGSTKQAKAA